MEEAAADVQARTWVPTYEALTQLLERNLADQLGVLEDLPESARRYMERANVVILEEELETFRGRLEFWRSRM